MKTLSKEAEQRILDAISDACNNVSGGMSPTDAVIKAAGDRNFNRNFVKLAVAGYNTGATTYQRQTGKTILEKMAEFPLAIEEKVLESLFPSKILAPSVEKNSAAVSTDYSQPPKRSMSKAAATLEKVASYKLDYQDVGETARVPGDPKIAMQTAYGQAEKVKNELDQVRRKYVEAQESMVYALGQFSDYFKQSAWDRDWSFSEVDAIAAQQYGRCGTSVMDYVHRRNSSKEARCSDIKSARAVAWSVSPFTLLDQCVKVGEELVNLRRQFNAKQAETETRVDEILRPFALSTQSSTGGATTQLDKQGTFWGGFQYNASKPLVDKMFSSTSPDEARQKAMQAFSNPVVDQEMQAIRARAMLYDLMQNDEIISGYDPEQTITGFNELSAMAPEASTRIAIMKPMLRKWLTQGVNEPFEISEIAKLENTMADTRGKATDLRQSAMPGIVKPPSKVLDEPKPALGKVV